MKSLVIKKILIALSAAALLVIPGASLLTLSTLASEVTHRSITISSSRASATDVTYSVRFNTDASQPAYNIGGIVIDFCSESAIVGDAACSTPPGFNLNEAGLALANQAGISGFAINASSDTNTLVITKNIASLINPGTTISFNLGSNGAGDGVTNPNSGNQSFYARIMTFTTAIAAANYTSGNPGIYIDSGGIALSTASPIDVSTVVPPFLFFCAGHSISGYDCSTIDTLYVSFGEFSQNYTSTGLSQLLVMTNSGSGFGIRVYGTTLTSGNNIIKALVPPHISNTGTEQFGMNLVANNSPAVGNDPVGPGSAVPTADYAVPNHFKYQHGDLIVSGNNVTDWRKFTISYIVNINQNQAPGIYTTTLTFICLANF